MFGFQGGGLSDKIIIICVITKFLYRKLILKPDFKIKR